MSKLQTLEKAAAYRDDRRKNNRSTAAICIVPNEVRSQGAVAWCDYPKQELDCSWCPMDNMAKWRKFLPCLD